MAEEEKQNPAEKPDEKPADKPVEKAAEKPGEKPEAKKTEESPQEAEPKTPEAAVKPEEGKKKSGIFARLKMEKTSFLWFALFGASLMNAVLLGIVSVKPSQIIERYRDTPQSHNQKNLPEDIPNPERHIDILFGMAEVQRRLGNNEKAMEFYTTANRAFEASGHGELLRRTPLQKAEKLFEQKKYREARTSYSAFLATADLLPAEDQALIELARYRIAESFLREALGKEEEHIGKQEEHK